MAAMEVSIFITSLMLSLSDHVTLVSGQSTLSTGQDGVNSVDLLEEILAAVNELKLRQSLQEQKRECSGGSPPGGVPVTTELNSVDELQTDARSTQRRQEAATRDDALTSTGNGWRHKQEHIEELLGKLLVAFNASLEQQQRLQRDVEMLGRKVDEKLSRASSNMEINGNVAAINSSSRPRDCADVMASGVNTSGVYTVFIGRSESYIRGVSVYCDMIQDGGGWTVFQRRQDGSENFYRSWNQFMHGFGNLHGEFWLGNDNLYSLTRNKRYTLRVDMTDFSGNKRHAVYDDFKIGTDCENFKLVSVGTYSGNAGDGLAPHVGSYFSTHDKDNDSWSQSCAVVYKGAWWHKACHHSSLNGYYYTKDERVTSSADGIDWYPWTGHKFPLRFSEMKIRPVTS